MFKKLKSRIFSGKKKFVFILLYCLLFGKIVFSQSIIGEGMSGDELKNFVIENYKTTSTLGYDMARDTLYAKIDLKEDNKLVGVYSGYEITLDLTQDPSSYAYQNGINCEHSWPQSMGASSEPQKSDMHLLYPCKINVNSSRGNDPFGEIPDIDTDRWYRFEEVLYSIPSTNIDEYSEKENDDPDLFEPRESKKGDIARSMFYFFCMYQEAADTTFWNIQKQTFLDWHYYDLPDSIELERTWKIAGYQDDCPNPFVIDTTLARRIWFLENDITIPGGSPQNLTYLRGNSPNPISGTTNIKYTIKHPTHVKLSVFNIKGQLVEILVNDDYESGIYELEWNPKNISTGIYFLQLQTKENSFIEKMIKIE